MGGFFNLTNRLKGQRQVYLFASLIVFLGFLAGGFYSNSVSNENYINYSGILKTYVGGIRNSAGAITDSYPDIKNILFIFLWSFFLFGKPLCGFFAFKSGFSIGFFISFFVKVYSFKGFLTGMAILFNYLVFFALPLIIFTAWSFKINTLITDAVFSSSKTNIKKAVVPYLIILFFSLVTAFVGNFINAFIVTKVMEALF